MRELYTEVDVNGSVEAVWAVLTNFSDYKNWNPFITFADGTAEVGQILNIVIEAEAGKKQKYKVKILESVKNKKLVWLGHFKVPYLIDGQHVYELVPISEAVTRVVHREEFTGLLVPLVWQAYINNHLLAGFIKMNLCLKKYVESKK